MVLVLGSNGFIGKSMCARLKKAGVDYYPSTHEECDLCSMDATRNLFEKVKPTIVINLAAFLGGVHFGYKHAAEMFTNNMRMQINILDACRDFNIKRLINPIANCVYPGDLDLYTEDKLWNGPMHESVLAFATAKKSLIVASWAYYKQYGLETMNLVLPNVYGPNDHFDEERSHAVGALIQKIVVAKRMGAPSVTILGSGKPIREWLYVEDAVAALYKAINADFYGSIINIGVGKGYSIQETAQMIQKIVGYEGKLVNDTSKMDGALCKQIDGKLGQRLLDLKPPMNFIEGLKLTIHWYMENIEK